MADDWMADSPVFGQDALANAEESESIVIPLDGIEGLEDDAEPLPIAPQPQRSGDYGSSVGAGIGRRSSRAQRPSIYDRPGSMASDISARSPSNQAHQRQTSPLSKQGSPRLDGVAEQTQDLSDIEDDLDNNNNNDGNGREEREEEDEPEGPRATGVDETDMRRGGTIVALNPGNNGNTAGKMSDDVGPLGGRARSETQAARAQLRKNEIEQRDCCKRGWDAFVSYQRVRLFGTLIHCTLSKMIFLLELALFLLILNDAWKTNNPFLFAIGFSCLIAPLVCFWSAMFIYCEQIVIEKVVTQSDTLICLCGYPSIFLYLIAPLGIIVLILLDISLNLYEWLDAFCRWIGGCLQTDHSSVLRSTGLIALRQFRMSTHVLCLSIPSLVWYGWIEYNLSWKKNRDYMNNDTNDNRPKWQLQNRIYLGALFNFLMIVDTFYTVYSQSLKFDIKFSHFFLTGLRLFGGKVPLSGLAEGTVTMVNWSSIAFGSYSFAKVSAALESPYCALSKIILSEHTLRSLNTQLCFHLGNALRLKKVRVTIVLPFTAQTMWKDHLGLSGQSTTMYEFKRALKSCALFSEKHGESFDKVYAELDYLYQESDSQLKYNLMDFRRDYAAEVYIPLIELHLYELVRNRDNENIKLLNLFLGAGLVNEVDPVTKKSALFYAVEQLDHELLEKLCAKGVVSSVEDWASFGNLVIDLVKKSDLAVLSATLNISLKRSQIDIDLDYRDDRGRTALHYAAENGNLEIVELLLGCNLNCDILAQDFSNRNAADIARDENHEKVEDYLRSHF